jgi:hypothetical protein
VSATDAEAVVSTINAAVTSIQTSVANLNNAVVPPPPPAPAAS